MRFTLQRVLGVLVVLLATGSSRPAVSLEVVREVLPSKVLGEDRPLNIVLPVDYGPDEPCPAVYALDGDPEHLEMIATGMQTAHPRLVIIGVENVDRSRDVFPDPIPEKSGRGGGGRAFLEFLTTELVPHIEATYATTGPRILSGQSNSGFFVLYALTAAPGAFDAYFASSPMIGWDWDLIRTETVAVFDEHTSLSAALYLNHGETDSNRTTEYLPRYVELLREADPDDLRWTFEIIEGEEHVPASGYANGVSFLLEDR